MMFLLVTLCAFGMNIKLHDTTISLEDKKTFDNAFLS